MLKNAPKPITIQGKTWMRKRIGGLKLEMHHHVAQNICDLDRFREHSEKNRMVFGPFGSLLYIEFEHALGASASDHRSYGA